MKRSTCGASGVSSIRSGSSLSILSKARAISLCESILPDRSDSRREVSSLWLALPSRDNLRSLMRTLPFGLFGSPPDNSPDSEMDSLVELLCPQQPGLDCIWHDRVYDRSHDQAVGEKDSKRRKNPEAGRPRSPDLMQCGSFLQPRNMNIGVTKARHVDVIARLSEESNPVFPGI
ncbi:hypothetical protein EYF80_027842 [Liparis tanakae]|uniref:Uncharacterized protein n=1 Tax=Liparis tanakae TaxID=230148 RepID=A0A4Z2H9I0_9TELE|nr:hypothetical protein EYF80_027842 [Liparis tanakae]